MQYSILHTRVQTRESKIKQTKSPLGMAEADAPGVYSIGFCQLTGQMGAVGH